MQARRQKFELDTFGRDTLTSNWSARGNILSSRIYYVNSGRASYTIDNTEHILCEKHIYVIPAFSDISYNLIPGYAFDHTYWDFFSNIPLKPTVVDIDTSLYPTLRQTVETAGLFFNEHDISQKSGDRIVYYNDPSIYQVALSFFRILYTLIDSIYPLNTDIDPRISNVLYYIHSNASADITIESLAKMSYLSVNHFIRLFKHDINMSPYQYIMEFRFNNALNILREGKSVEQAAAAAGYTSVFSFSKAFKKHFNISPNSYYNIHRDEALADSLL